MKHSLLPWVVSGCAGAFAVAAVACGGTDGALFVPDSGLDDDAGGSSSGASGTSGTSKAADGGTSGGTSGTTSGGTSGSFGDAGARPDGATRDASAPDSSFTGDAAAGDSGPTLRCQSAADCSGGDVCCFESTNGAFVASCRNDCNGGERVQACKTQAECQIGTCAVHACKLGGSVETCGPIPNVCP